MRDRGVERPGDAPSGDTCLASYALVGVWANTTVKAIYLRDRTSLEKYLSACRSQLCGRFRILPYDGDSTEQGALKLVDRMADSSSRRLTLPTRHHRWVRESGIQIGGRNSHEHEIMLMMLQRTSLGTVFRSGMSCASRSPRSASS